MYLTPGPGPINKNLSSQYGITDPSLEPTTMRVIHVDDQTNILNGSYSWYQGVQVEGIKDS